MEFDIMCQWKRAPMMFELQSSTRSCIWEQGAADHDGERTWNLFYDIFPDSENRRILKISLYFGQ